jgi:hypothetical protein
MERYISKRMEAPMEFQTLSLSDDNPHVHVLEAARNIPRHPS